VPLLVALVRPEAALVVEEAVLVPVRPGVATAP